MGKKNESSIGMSFRLPTEMYQAFSTAVKEKGVSMTDVVKDAVEKFLQKENEELPLQELNEALDDMERRIENLVTKVDNLTAITTAVLKTVLKTDDIMEKLSKDN